jgi:hypothetical protein
MLKMAGYNRLRPHIEEGLISCCRKLVTIYAICSVTVFSEKPQLS